MKILDSLQMLGYNVFYNSSKLVLSYIDVSDNGNDVTSQVVPYLRDQQRFAALEKMLAERDAEVATLTTEFVTLTTENSAQATEIAALTSEVTALKIANAPAAPTAPTNDFISTIDFKRHFVEFVHIEMLLVLREVCKEWNEVVKDVVDESVESGAMIVHGGEDLQWSAAREERRKLVTQVVFLLNNIKVGDRACWCAVNLVVVDIPEGVESIGVWAFQWCSSLTTVSFPTTLKSINEYAFDECSSLDNVDLLHTNLQELGKQAFSFCSELKSMTIPDSLQTVGDNIFYGCFELVSSSIDI
ncbi:hypothetical protein TL16_g02386 [Triparma laevis f. inornata]|uniref:Uncharacterized protein n=1 Tax=Triparma laevis f. inornata TaxID=1714386 RepID=A0A9W7DX80_9STRA|nr:hypothetical protein TL16_g02386 [Triparma laevis f. inornata]